MRSLRCGCPALHFCGTTEKEVDRARFIIESSGCVPLCERRLWEMTCLGEGTPGEVKMREALRNRKSLARS